MSEPISNNAVAELQPMCSKPERLLSIDVFRGMVIFLMVFVNMVASLGDLPGVGRWMGSAPVSIWRHASAAYDSPVWRGTEDGTRWREATVVARTDSEGRGKTSGRVYDVAVKDVAGKDIQTTVTGVVVEAPKQLRPGAPVIAQWDEGQNRPISFQFPENGCTLVDLVAPFFVFIVGVCIPFSRRSRGARGVWWRHVFSRTFLLIGLGFVDMSLGAGVSYWWGILQAIGLAYLVAACLDYLADFRKGVWVISAICVMTGLAAVLSLNCGWWTFVGNPDLPPFSIRNLTNCDYLRPLNAHCTPWAGLVGYGLCASFGALLGRQFIVPQKGGLIGKVLLCGFVQVCLGLLLQQFIPMSKEEVTVSYAFFTSGLGTLLFVAVYWVVDVRRLRGWTYVFTVFGSNALLAFFLQPIVRITFEKFGLMQFYYNHQGWNAMLWGLIWVFTLWAVVRYCNRRGWYWKI